MTQSRWFILAILFLARTAMGLQFQTVGAVGPILADSLGIDYAAVPGLSNEARHKLQAAQPRTIGQASRIEAMTPAALGILAAYLRRQSREKTA